jgi:hypothetical protein
VRFPDIPDLSADQDAPAHSNCEGAALIVADPRLIPPRFCEVAGLPLPPRGDPLQFREMHAIFSAKGQLEGRRAETRLGRELSDPAPALPLVTLAEAFSGRTPPPDVLLFGDSTSLLVSRFDVWRQPLFEMLVRRFRPLRTCVVAHIGWHGSVQAALLRAVAALPCQPKVVFLPMSLRQTTPQWAANPYFQFEGLIDAANVVALYPTADIPAVAPFPRGAVTEPGPDIDAAEWEKFRSVPVDMAALDMASTGARTVGDVIDLIGVVPEGEAALRERARTVFAYHWLPGDDPKRLEELGEALRIAEGFGARVVGQLTPFNYETGRQLLGDAFDRVASDFVSTTTRVCMEAMANSEHLFLEDLSHLLPAKEFFYVNDPTEHYGEVGRAAVARHMAKVVRRAAAARSTRP